MDYYNEIEPFAAQWLRNLIEAGVLPRGEVDTRDIRDVHPGDLRGYRRCHFFAGIGIWAYAVEHAGWPADRPVWTGSCPCQPFSTAGAGIGFADERHLWPYWFHLVEKCRPAIVLGEQVASKDADAWIDLVQNDMEGLGYAVGALPHPAASVSAPHIRDRLYWVAYADGKPCRKGGSQRGGRGAGGDAKSWADSGVERQREGNGCVNARRLGQAAEHSVDDGIACGVADPSAAGRGFIGGRGGDCEGHEGSHAHEPDDAHGAGPVAGFWRGADWLLCRDGRWRPVEPGTFPLAHGYPTRVGRLRAYGNAIVEPQARAFVKDVMEVIL